MTLLTELVILGLFAMSLDLHGRLHTPGLLRACGRLRPGGLRLGLTCCFQYVAAIALAVIPGRALMTGTVAIGVGWVCTLADRRLVRHADARVRAARLCDAIPLSNGHRVTGGSDGLAGIPRRAGPMGMTLLTSQGRVLLLSRSHA